MIYFPKCYGKGSFPKSQIKSLGMAYLCIFGEEGAALLGAMTDKWVWKLVCGQN